MIRDIFNIECQVSKPLLFFSFFHIHELSKNSKKRYLTPLPEKKTKSPQILFSSYIGGFPPANQKNPKSEPVRGRRCTLVYVLEKNVEYGKIIEITEKNYLTPF